MERVKSIKAEEGYRLLLVFTDGTEGVVDLSERLFGPVFEPLKDRDLFRQVTVDDYGVPCWPNGADLAPDALYLEIKKKHEAHAR